MLPRSGRRQGRPRPDGPVAPGPRGACPSDTLWRCERAPQAPQSPEVRQVLSPIQRRCDLSARTRWRLLSPGDHFPGVHPGSLNRGRPVSPVAEAKLFAGGGARTRPKRGHPPLGGRLPGGVHGRLQAVKCARLRPTVAGENSLFHINGFFFFFFSGNRIAPRSTS